MVSVKFLRFVNKYVLFFVLLVLFPFKFLFKRKNVNKKVLIIRLWALGDTISMIPLIKTLSFKGYKVDVLTTKNVSFLFDGYSFVNKIHLFNYLNPIKIIKLLILLRKNNYSIVIDNEQFLNVSTVLGLFTFCNKFIGYDHLFRSYFYTDRVEYIEEKHFVDNFFELLKPLNINNIEKKLVPLNYKKSSVNKVNNLLKDYKKKKFVAIHMGSGGTAKGRRWSSDNFLKLVNKISKKRSNIVIIFTGLDDEQKIYDDIKDGLNLKNELNLINKLSLSDFIYLFKKIDIFISNDTGPMHISAAMGCKTIGLFGMNNPKKVGAWPLDKNVNIYKNPKENPIINNKYSRYPSDKYSTIDLISVDDVFKEVVRILKK